MSTEQDELNLDNEYESDDSRNYFSDEEKYIEYKKLQENDRKEIIDIKSMDNLYNIHNELIEWSKENGFFFFNTPGYCSFHLHEFLKFFFK